MSTTYLTHTTVEGERWDQIAWAYYGNVGRMGALIAANPHIPITLNLPAGTKLRIPIMDAPGPSDEDAAAIPEWRRP